MGMQTAERSQFAAASKRSIFAALTEAADVKTLVLVPKSLLCEEAINVDLQ